mmetsp:Transcript_18860/g.37031  ORF Transcript_18860/g.37031 Transcript_18860/m.37031 type:complete len:123 (-) Transcript_18860:45-413(-)
MPTTYSTPSFSSAFTSNSLTLIFVIVLLSQKRIFTNRYILRLKNSKRSVFLVFFVFSVIMQSSFSIPLLLTGGPSRARTATRTSQPSVPTIEFQICRPPLAGRRVSFLSSRSSRLSFCRSSK